MAEWLGFVEPLPPGEDMALFSDQKPSVSLSSIYSLLASIFREVICSHIASFWWDQSTGREHRPNPTPSSAHSVLDCFVHGVRVPREYRLMKARSALSQQEKGGKMCVFIIGCAGWRTLTTLGTHSFTDLYTAVVRLPPVGQSIIPTIPWTYLIQLLIGNPPLIYVGSKEN